MNPHRIIYLILAALLALPLNLHAAGQIGVMRANTGTPLYLKGGDGIDITTAGEIKATGVPAGGVSATTFTTYTSAQSDLNAAQDSAISAAAGVAGGALQPGDDGSTLVEVAAKWGTADLIVESLVFEAYNVWKTVGKPSISAVTRLGTRHPEGTIWTGYVPARVLVEGVDYKVDYAGGRVMLLSTASTSDLLYQGQPSPFGSFIPNICWLSYYSTEPSPTIPKSGKIPRWFAKVISGGTVRVAAFGDSTTMSDYASDVELPAHKWVTRWANNIQKEWPSTSVTVTGMGVGGSNTDSIDTDAEIESKLSAAGISSTPQDLILINFGTNEQSTGRDVTYETNITNLINYIRVTKGWSNTDFALIKPQVGNYDYYYTQGPANMLALQAKMDAMSESIPNVAVADVWSNWTNNYLTRKTYHDLLHNDLNHAGSYSAWIWVESLGALVPAKRKLTTEQPISNDPYGAGWSGVASKAPSMDAVYDKIEALSVGAGSVSDTAFASTWNGVTTASPSKNTIWDAFGTSASVSFATVAASSEVNAPVGNFSVGFVSPFIAGNNSTVSGGSLAIVSTNNATKGDISFDTAGRKHASGGWSFGNTADPGATNISVVGAAKVGSLLAGTTTATAKFTAYESTALGTLLGNAQILSSVSGRAGSQVYRKEWLYRRADGSDFTTADWFDGIDIDGAFSTPMTNTRVWMRRSAGQETFTWGSQATTSMTLTKAGALTLPGALTAGSIPSPGAIGGTTPAAITGTAIKGQQYTETANSATSVSVSGTVTPDCTTASLYAYTLTGSTTITLPSTGIPAGVQTCTFSVAGAQTLTLGGTVAMVGEALVQPVATKETWLTCNTRNQGAKWFCWNSGVEQ